MCFHAVLCVLTAQEIEKKLGSQEKAVVDAAKAVKAACDTLFESF